MLLQFLIPMVFEMRKYFRDFHVVLCDYKDYPFQIMAVSHYDP